MDYVPVGKPTDRAYVNDREAGKTHPEKREYKEKMPQRRPNNRAGARQRPVRPKQQMSNAAWLKYVQKTQRENPRNTPPQSK